VAKLVQLHLSTRNSPGKPPAVLGGHHHVGTPVFDPGSLPSGHRLLAYDVAWGFVGAQTRELRVA
jgi:hypothetical protein